MQKSSPNPAQGNLLFPNLIDQLDPRHPLLKLAQHIPWQFFEDAFAPLYSHRGKLPCDSSDMTYFRKRIGEAGFEKILSSSIALFGEAAQEEEVCIDSTVQE